MMKLHDPGYLEVAEIRRAASTMEFLALQEGITHTDSPGRGVQIHLQEELK